MRILLVYPPHTREIVMGYPSDYTRKARSDLPPLGLLYLSSYLKKNHDVKIVDMSASGMEADGITTLLDSFSPGLVGISCVITHWMPVLDIARAVKKSNPSLPVVVGGPNPTYYPDETLAEENIDYVICGLGQIPLMELADQLESGRIDKDIEYCYGHNSPSPKIRPLPRPVSVDLFPYPDRSALPIDLYNVPFCPENPTTSILSSQGCCFRCAFCNCWEGKPVQVRSFEKVVDEMEGVGGLGIRSIMFQDDLFTIDAERVRKLCAAIIRRGIKINWTLKSRVDCIQEWMPALMKEAGCFNVHFGIESGNDKTLTRMKKGTTVAQSAEAVRMVKKGGLSCTGNFMLGYPGEDEKDIRNTIDFAVGLGLNLSQFSITMDIAGTELYGEAVKSGRRKPGDPYREFVLDPENTDITHLFSSDLFNGEQMFAFLREAYSKTRTLYDVSRE